MYTSRKELNGKSQLREILEALDILMENLAITMKGTGVGCYFFNCSKTSDNKRNGIYSLFSLSDLSVKNIKKLHDILEDTPIQSNNNGDDNIFDLENPDLLNDPLYKLFPLIKYSNEKEFESKKTGLNEVFAQMNSEFMNTKSRKYNNKKIFFFTDNDKPFDPNSENGQSLKRKIRTIKLDLNSEYINIVNFFIGSKEKAFNPNLYNEILFIKHTKDPFSISKKKDESKRFNNFIFDAPNTKHTASNDIKSKVLRKKEVKRVLFQCPLEIGPNLIISVKGFGLYSREAPKKPENFYSKSQILKKVNNSFKYIDQISGKEINKTSCIVKCYKFGEELIILNKNQLEKINNFENFENESNENNKNNKNNKGDSNDENHIKYSKPWLRIIGFKKIQDAFNPQYNFGKSSFIAPNPEGSFTNSFRAFSSLYQSMIKTKRAAIIWGYLKKNSSPALFALIPSKNYEFEKIRLNKRNKQVKRKEGLYFPEGLFLMPLPFKDCIRRIPEHVMSVEVDENLLALTKGILGRFELWNAYKPNDFSNPSLLWHYKVLRDEVLQTEIDPDSDVSKAWEIEDYEKRKNLLSNFDKTLERVSKIRELIVSSIPSQDEMKQMTDEDIESNVALLIQIWNTRINGFAAVNDMKENIEKPIKSAKIAVEYDLTNKDVMAAWQQNRLSDFKVLQLRKFIMKNRGFIEPATKKNDMINNIKEFFESKQ
ncbi:ATP-dependent DNA helicase YKU70 [Ascoidea rubescens DSM 1968]|uniref:ATP-dependent DNA helicase II subunit 1 n=1 Tax=Ascoidea rubescens DSM 1968 TaxID=1344418 RepID=A0A1D2VL50_9ASCO|nr:SPOC domain-like protein [Ascoidea rubescens DSM 1968]ODV62324.1 SPOC domain-like protein [Ascoidea rubescens DSM 1968]